MNDNSDYVITTDNGSDLGENRLTQLGVDETKLTVIIDDEEYDGIDRKISSKEIFNLMKKGARVTTSQVNPNQAEEFFERYLKEGKDILHISLGSNLSGTYNSYVMVKGMLTEKYPDRRIEIIDTRSGSIGEGLFVVEACRQRDAGKSMEEIVASIEEKKKRLQQLFVLDDLRYLQQGGRLSKSKEIIGSIVGIKPILTINQDGKIVELDKYIGRNKAISAMIDKVEETIDIESNPFIAISHGNSPEDAGRVAQIIEKRLGIKEIIIEELGPIIGAHGGQGTLTIFYIGSDTMVKKQDMRRRALYEKFRNNHR